MGFVQTDQHHHAGIVDGRHPHKAGNAGVFVLRIQLLAGAGFAAHPEARHIGVFAAALQHHLFHHCAHFGAGFLGDHLPHHGGRGFMHKGSVCVRDPLHQIGLHPLAAVHHGRHSHRHLNGRDLAGLAEGTAGQFHRAHPVGGVIFALFRFRRQVNAGGPTQAKSLEIIAESLLAQPCPHLNKRLIAGVHQGVRQVLAAVMAMVGAVESGSRHVD